MLWLVLLSEVPASEREHPVLQLAVALWPIALLWKLLSGAVGEFLPLLLRRAPFVVAGGVVAWALILFASAWEPRARDDFGLLTPGVVIEEALYAYPLTWALLVALGLWRLRAFLQEDRAAVFGASKVVLLVWAWELVGNLSLWLSASHGYVMAFLWLNIAAGFVPMAVVLGVRRVLANPTELPRSTGWLTSSRIGERAAILSVLFLAASLVALIERVNFDRVLEELERARGAARTCQELERQLPERSPCRGAE
ncbi:MAG: hypothetical protein AAF690_01170 [Acidobacteriota bacterium]